MSKQQKRQEGSEIDPIFEGTEEAIEPSGGSLAIPEESLPAVRQIKPDLVLHAGDRPISWAKLGQATSAQGTPGRFFFQETNEEVDELHLIPATIQAVRSLWPEGDSPGGDVRIAPLRMAFSPSPTSPRANSRSSQARPAVDVSISSPSLG